MGGLMEEDIFGQFVGIVGGICIVIFMLISIRKGE